MLRMGPQAVENETGYGPWPVRHVLIALPHTHLSYRHPKQTESSKNVSGANTLLDSVPGPFRQLHDDAACSSSTKMSLTQPGSTLVCSNFSLTSLTCPYSTPRTQVTVRRACRLHDEPGHSETCLDTPRRAWTLFDVPATCPDTPQRAWTL